MTADPNLIALDEEELRALARLSILISAVAGFTAACLLGVAVAGARSRLSQ